MKDNTLPMGRSSAMNDTLTWDDVRELRKLWPRAAAWNRERG